MCRSIPLISIILFGLCVNISLATSIIPYSHLGELALESNYIAKVEVIQEQSQLVNGETHFYYLVHIVDPIKGNFPANTIRLQREKKIAKGFEKIVFGDISLLAGKTYLLFLDHLEKDLFKPKVMNYYVFQEAKYHGNTVLIPSLESVHLNKETNDQVEPLQNYESEKLITYLKSFRGDTHWDTQNFISEYQNLSIETRSAQPAHCTNYYDKNPTRWTSFDLGKSIPIYMDQDVDPLKSNTQDLLIQAMDGLQSGTPGSSIDLEFGGVKDFDPCTTDAWHDVSATGYNLTLWAEKNIGMESIYVQFEDPCGELKSFVCGQKGVLAVGGLFRSIHEQHEYRGEKFYNGYLGYVLVAKGAGCISDEGYKQVLMHELSHALSFGHIAGSRSALMNSSCCNPLSDLDQSCYEYLYQNSSGDSITDAQGEIHNQRAVISFSTNIPREKTVFEVQKKDSFGGYKTIGKIPYTNMHTGKIEIEDRSVAHYNEYQIQWLDQSGALIDDAQVIVKKQRESNLNIFPNPSSPSEMVNINTSGLESFDDLRIYTVTGKMIYHQQINSFSGPIQVAPSIFGAKTGTYILQLQNSVNTLNSKLVIR